MPCSTFGLIFTKAGSNSWNAAQTGSIPYQNIIKSWDLGYFSNNGSGDLTYYRDMDISIQTPSSLTNTIIINCHSSWR